MVGSAHLARRLVHAGEGGRSPLDKIKSARAQGLWPSSVVLELKVTASHRIGAPLTPFD